MKKIKSISDKRLIVEGSINEKQAYFLIDTGASVGLIDSNQQNDYKLQIGKKYNGTLIGAGGEMINIKHCNTFVNMANKKIPQFLLADIESVVNAIYKETGIKILGIIGLSQMKITGIQIDTNDNLILIEDEQ